MNRRSSDLMKKMGSRNGAFDPEPPDQWLYNLNHADGPERVLAWIKSKTIAIGHDSAWAIDEHTRQPLKVAHMANAFGCKVQSARNALNELEAQGRARTDEHGRIGLCADVPLARLPREAESTSKTDQPDEWGNFVQSCFSGYLADSIRSLPAHLHASFQTKYSAFAELRPKVFAEAAAAARSITERYEDTILAEFGIERRKIAKRRDSEPQLLRLELVDEANFVQSFKNGANGHSVQSGKTGLYKAENGSVQTQKAGVSLLVPDPDPDTKSSSSPSGVVGKPQTTTTTAPITAEKPDAQPRKTEFRKRLVAVFMDARKSPPNREQCDKVLEILPIDGRWDYLSQLQAKIGRVNSAGVLKTDAQTFAAAWQDREERKQATREREETRSVTQNEEGRELARQIIADPNADERDKALAQELLGGR